MPTNHTQVEVNSTNDNHPSGSNETIANRLAEQVTKDSFDEWYQERTIRQNLLDGKPFFNQPKQPKPPDYHTPSGLLKCHRKTTYSRLATPEETRDPHGIFHIGSMLEEELILPYLQELTDQSTYITNSIWINFHANETDPPVELKGATDPVFTDEHGVPILPTEAKSRRSVNQQNSPSRKHKAQIHAYMEGLSRKYDQEIREGLIIYIGKENLDINLFHIEFDHTFWQETVLDWAREQTRFRANHELPPATPVQPWECDYCSFRERCGEGDRGFEDTPPHGFLPLIRYPREKVKEYLNGDSERKLTPTLAHEYPDLAEWHGVHDWECTHCSFTQQWNQVEWDGDVESPPQCPKCVENNVLNSLRSQSIKTTNNSAKFTLQDEASNGEVL